MPPSALIYLLPTLLGRVLASPQLVHPEGSDASIPELDTLVPGGEFQAAVASTPGSDEDDPIEESTYAESSDVSLASDLETLSLPTDLEDIDLPYPAEPTAFDIPPYETPSGYDLDMGPLYPDTTEGLDLYPEATEAPLTTTTTTTVTSFESCPTTTITISVPRTTVAATTAPVVPTPSVSPVQPASGAAGMSVAWAVVLLAVGVSSLLIVAPDVVLFAFMPYR